MLDRPQRRADRADAGEKRVAGEIVSARQGRARGRQQARLELDIVARRDVGRVAGRHPDPARNLLLRHAVGADDADHHARADGPQVHFLDEALQADDADAVEHRRGDSRRAQRHRQETGEQRGDGEREAESERAGAGDPRERGEEGDHQRRQPQDRLAVGGQIERDAAHRRDRDPQEEAPLLDLARQRARERAAPVRRPRGGAGPAGRRGESASACRCRHSGIETNASLTLGERRPIWLGGLKAALPLDGAGSAAFVAADRTLDRSIWIFLARRRFAAKTPV